MIRLDNLRIVDSKAVPKMILRSLCAALAMIALTVSAPNSSTTGWIVTLSPVMTLSARSESFLSITRRQPPLTDVHHEGQVALVFVFHMHRDQAGQPFVAAKLDLFGAHGIGQEQKRDRLQYEIDDLGIESVDDPLAFVFQSDPFSREKPFC
jgi:hypothetical protein